MEQNTHPGDDSMEKSFRVAKTMLSYCELAEVLRGAWDHVIEQPEHDLASRFRFYRHIKLQIKHT
jgi:hypothetical protein